MINHPMALLIVTILGGAGPHRVSPFRLTDGVVKVSHNGVVVARAKSGRLKVHLRPGWYRVSASLLPPNPSRPCEVRSVQLKRERTARLNLSCMIK
jgi:hypothetical protein